VNQNGRAGAIRCTRLNVQWAVRSSSIRSALVGELILLLLSHAQNTTTQLTLYVLPSTTFHTLHSVNESSLELAVTLCNILMDLHPRYYLSYSISSLTPTLSIKHNISSCNLHLNDSSTANTDVFLAGLSVNGKIFGQPQQQQQLQ
jgi:hypothetical protein